MKMVTTLREIETIFDQVNVGEGVLDKISVWHGDITKLKIDAIVNAAKMSLGGGGGIDDAIHKAAGYHELQAECKKIGHCAVGNTVATSACKLTHVKKIFHTVGPQVRGRVVTKKDQVQLLSCYTTALELAVKHDLRSIAFPCISTGIYGYPNDDAANAVMNHLCKFFLESEHKDKIDRVVVCVFVEVDKRCYEDAIEHVVERFVQLESQAPHKKSQTSCASRSRPTPRRHRAASGSKKKPATQTRRSASVQRDGDSASGSRSSGSRSTSGSRYTGGRSLPSASRKKPVSKKSRRSTSRKQAGAVKIARTRKDDKVNAGKSAQSKKGRRVVADKK